MTLMKEEYIFLNQNLTTKDDVLEFLSQKAMDLQISTDKYSLKDSYEKRESEGSTGMMDGFAIPHAKDKSVLHPSIIVVKLNEGIDWGSLDDQPTDVIISLLIPEDEAGTTHLQLLSKVARSLMKEEFQEKLKVTDNSSELSEYFLEVLEG